MENDIIDATRLVMERIKDAVQKKQPWAQVDFVGSIRYVASRAIQKVLIERGYVVVVLLGGREDPTERLYVDIARSMKKADVQDK
jgi:hypothetical protein